ncbi:hypothetical protein BDW68DRAFT_79537 [Aspergillus falconensis]
MNDGEESEKIRERGAKEVCGRGESECTTRSGSEGCDGLERSRRGRCTIATWLGWLTCFPSRRIHGRRYTWCELKRIVLQ